jgi:hypothetical protein
MRLTCGYDVYTRNAYRICGNIVGNVYFED